VSDETLRPEPTEAIDLARRKSRDVGREARDAVVRVSILGAKRAAAPYVTMARIVGVELGRSRLARAGALVLACLALVAIFADVIASELPLATRYHGVVYVMPNVTHPPALAGLDCDAMRRDLAAGDWIIPPLASHGPTEAGERVDPLLPPLSTGHLFGTDAFGRDIFARIVHGARTALGLGLAASAALVFIGVLLGALAGFVGGMFDALVARAIESFTAIPTLVLVLVVEAIVPHPTTSTLVWTIALTRWAELARLVRADVLVALGQDYVVAARALGASSWRVLRRHVLPNALAPAIVTAAFAVATVILIEAAVDFLRVGSPDTMASWGETMGESRAHAGAWWLLAFPGAMLVVTLIALNLVAEAMRNALDPRLRGGGELVVRAEEAPAPISAGEVKASR
jgi:peptide/nickel transport system permease protein